MMNIKNILANMMVSEGKTKEQVGIVLSWIELFEFDVELKGYGKFDIVDSQGCFDTEEDVSIIDVYNFGVNLIIDKIESHLGTGANVFGEQGRWLIELNKVSKVKYKIIREMTSDEYGELVERTKKDDILDLVIEYFNEFSFKIVNIKDDEITTINSEEDNAEATHNIEFWVNYFLDIAEDRKDTYDDIDFVKKYIEDIELFKSYSEAI